MNEKLSLDHLLAGPRGHGRCAFLLVQFLIEIHNRLVHIYRDLHLLPGTTDQRLESEQELPIDSQFGKMEDNFVRQEDVTRAHTIVLGSSSADETLISLALAHINEDIDEMGAERELIDFDSMQIDLAAHWLINKPFIIEEVIPIILNFK